jgi:hypothetical protein
MRAVHVSILSVLFIVPVNIRASEALNGTTTANYTERGVCEGAKGDKYVTSTLFSAFPNVKCLSDNTIEETQES